MSRVNENINTRAIPINPQVDVLTRLLHGQTGRGLDYAGRVGAHALEYTRVDVQQTVYPEIVSVKQEKESL